MALTPRQKREILILAVVVVLLGVALKAIDSYQAKLAPQGTMQVPPLGASGSGELADLSWLISGEEEQVALRVNGVEFTVGDVRTEIRSLVIGGWPGGPSEQTLLAAAGELIQRVLMPEVAAREGVAPDEEEILQQVDSMLENLPEEMLRAKSAISGKEVSQDDLRQKMIMKVRAEQSIAQLKEKLFPLDEISDQEVEEFLNYVKENYGDLLESWELSPEELKTAGRLAVQDRRFGEWYRKNVLSQAEIEILAPELQDFSLELTGGEYLQGEEGEAEAGAESSPEEEGDGGQS